MLVVRKVLRGFLPRPPAPPAPPRQRRGCLHLSPPFIVEDYEPAAREALRSGALERSSLEGRRHLEDCRLCPRDCGVDRTRDLKGACNTGLRAVVSTAFPHFGEESVLQGWNGSGTVFFSLCNLRCVFCQNWDISQRRQGWEMDAEGIADLMLRLQDETRGELLHTKPPRAKLSY